MQNEYLIRIFTLQIVEGEKEEMEVTTTATVDFSGNGYIIKYKEVNIEDVESTTTIRVENDSAVYVTRESDINTHMIIEKGVRHISHHVTPYGTFSLGINAIRIESQMTPNGGTLNFKYTTDIEMSTMSEIEFKIKLSKKTPSIIREEK